MRGTTGNETNLTTQRPMDVVVVPNEYSLVSLREDVAIDYVIGSFLTFSCGLPRRHPHESRGGHTGHRGSKIESWNKSHILLSMKLRGLLSTLTT